MCPGNDKSLLPVSEGQPARALLWTQRIQNTRERIIKDPTSLVHKRMWWSVQLPAFLSGIQGKGLFESLKPRKGDAYADF